MYAKKTAVQHNKNNKQKNKNSVRKSVNEVKNMKNTKNAKNKRGFFFFSKILFVVFTVIILLNLGTNLHKINAQKDELELLKQEYNSKRINNEALRQQLEAPVDDDYIIDIVKQMGYRKADEILFYLNSED